MESFSSSRLISSRKSGEATALESQLFSMLMIVSCSALMARPAESGLYSQWAAVPQAQQLVALPRGVAQQAHAHQVVHLVQGPPLFPHLAVDRVEVLDAAFHLDRDARRFGLPAHRLFHGLQEAAPLALPLVHPALDLLPG